MSNASPVDVHVDVAGAVVPSALAGSLRLRVRAYLRMGRTIRYENWLGTLIWWSLLPGAIAFRGRTLALLAVTLLAYMAAVASGGTLDDVQGFRDGSDVLNYRRSDPTGLRPMTRKPLLLGWVTEAQALAYAGVMAVVTVVADGAAFLVSGRHLWWYLPLHLGLALLGTQYSYGLKLSYRGAQELVLLAGMIGTVVLPHALVTGGMHADALVLGVLFACWFVIVSSFSNVHDAEGDRHAERRTMAVLVSRTADGRFITAVFAGSVVAWVAAIALGWLSPWVALVLVPVAVIQLRALDGRDRPRRAPAGPADRLPGGACRRRPPLPGRGRKELAMRHLRFTADESIGVLCDRAAARFPDATITMDEPSMLAPERGTVLDYAGLAELVADVSGSLRAAGVTFGDRIAVVKRNHFDIVVLAAAAARLGAVGALLAPSIPADDAAVMLGRLAPRAIVADSAAIRAWRLDERTRGSTRCPRARR